jgi:predicted DNA-binding WGR domain protein
MKYYLELIDPVENHMKFYEASNIGKIALFKWGRIGTAGQQEAFSFDTDGEAETYVDNKVAEKLKKGYEFKNKEMRVRA